MITLYIDSSPSWNGCNAMANFHKALCRLKQGNGERGKPLNNYHQEYYGVKLEWLLNKIVLVDCETHD